MKAADRIRRRYWRLRGTTIHGVMVLAFTPDDELVLVRQTYSPGWGLPGGGRGRNEDPTAAALRELREEIGLVRWTGVTSAGSFDHIFSGVPASIDLVRVDGVIFRFRPNLEIEAVSTVDPHSLPDDISPWSMVFIEAAKVQDRDSGAEV